MHETEFALAAAPRPARILGLPLRPYAIGHELYLLRRANPLADPQSLDEPGLADLTQAVLICAHSWAELTSPPRWWRLKMALWQWRIRKQLLDPAPAIRAFTQYRTAGMTEPPCLPALLESGESNPREPGAPFLLRLIQFLIFRLRLSEPEAMDYPLGKAVWHACAYWESENGIRIKNRSELYMEKFVAEQEALAAGRPNN